MAILVADIGATNARFRLGLNGTPLVFPTVDYSDASALLASVRDKLDAPIEAAVLAVAGPADPNTGSIAVTNTGLRFATDEVAAVLGCAARLINDFFALAHAVPHCERLVQIGGEASHDGVKAVVGPGTGLGMATLVPSGESWRVLATEGGHADLAPGSFLELELWGSLTHAHGHVSWETVLCGNGLANLYRAVAELWGGKPEELSPEVITQRGVSLEDPVCHQTLETFCGLLGAAAGNLALTVGAVGGVYIGGGIAPQILDFLQTSPLRRRFDERGDLSEYVRKIPLWVIMDEEPGLTGAFYCLSDHFHSKEN